MELPIPEPPLTQRVAASTGFVRQGDLHSSKEIAAWRTDRVVVPLFSSDRPWDVADA